MDSTTSEVRKAHWAKIVAACQSRPAGMSAKQWIAENEISEKRYYYWQRKLRKDAYEQMNLDGGSNLLPSTRNSSEVSFAEIPFSATDSSTSQKADICPHPVAAIQLKNAQIIISNEMSADLLRCILQEVSHA